MSTLGFVIPGPLAVPIVAYASIPLFVDSFGADSTGVSDSTAALAAAYSALPASGGTLVFRDGGSYQFSNLVFSRPVRMQLQRANLVQKPGSTGAMIQTTSNLQIVGQSQNEAVFNPVAGATALKLASPWVNGGIGQYYGPTLLLSDVGFAGGATAVDTTALTGFYEGCFHIERCLFHDTTATALIVGNSVYYGFVTRSHFYHCQQGVTIGTATETKFLHNVWVQAQGGGPSVTAFGCAHVVLERDEFYGWTGVTSPDLLLGAINDATDGVIDIVNCKFGAELEQSFTTSRNRAQINSPGNGSISGTATSTLQVRFRDNHFYGPGAMTVTKFVATGAAATATITPNNGTDHGLQVGDQFWIAGDPIVAHSGFQGGPFTATVRTPTSVTWASALGAVTYTGVSALVLPGSVSAIAVKTPMSRCDFDDNNFQGYSFAIDDTSIITDGTRDQGGRCTYSPTNKMAGPLGLGCQEFKLAGRQMMVFKPRSTSPLLSFDADARINETPELRNRIEVDSESFTHWGATGSVSFVGSVADPFGTTRACTISRGGAQPIWGNTVWPAQGLSEGYTVAYNATGLKATCFLSFWARLATSGTVCGTMQVCCFNNFNGNMMLNEQVTLGPVYKRYRLPFVNDTTVTSPALIVCPGGVDAMPASVDVFGWQVDDYGGDYIPVTYTGSDASVVVTTQGNRWERAIVPAGGIFAPGFTVTGGSLSGSAGTPANWAAQTISCGLGGTTAPTAATLALGVLVILTATGNTTSNITMDLSAAPNGKGHFEFDISAITFGGSFGIIFKNGTKSTPTLTPSSANGTMIIINLYGANTLSYLA